MRPWSHSVLGEADAGQQIGAPNPFDVFHKTTAQDQTSFIVCSKFVRNVIAKFPCDIALFVDRGIARGF